MFKKKERPRKVRVSDNLREIPEAELQRVTGGGPGGGRVDVLAIIRDRAGDDVADRLLAIFGG